MDIVFSHSVSNVDRKEKVNIYDWLIDFNGMSTCLELFYA